MAYQVNVHENYVGKYDDKTYDADNSYFWYITFNNVSKDADGNIASGLNDYNTPDDKITIDSGVKRFSIGNDTYHWYYHGYTSLDNLYSAAVTKYIETYNHQDNVA